MPRLPAAREITFDAEKHLYKLNGVAVPSVTQVLNDSGISDFRKIPQEILQRAAQFGTAVHKACELSDKGTLDVARLSPALAPCLESWKQFRADYKIETVETERRVSHLALQYAGTLDRIVVMGAGRLKGKLALLDIKTGLVMYAAQLQTAGYKLAYEEETGSKIKLRMVVKLPEEGGYIIHPFENESDEIEWRAVFKYHSVMRRENLKMGGDE